jgi:hypothetical protein
MVTGKSVKKIESRLEIVAPLFRRGYTYRAIQREVMARLDLKSYSLQTVKHDIDHLLARWREQELGDTGEYVRLELARIDEIIRELWEQWEKSKQDYKKTAKKRKGRPFDGGYDEAQIRTIEREIQETEMRCLGDVSYISEIRAQLAERRKLLGLYAPEKKDITTDGDKITNMPTEVIFRHYDGTDNDGGE